METEITNEILSIPTTYANSTFKELIDRDCTISPVVESLKKHVNTMYYFLRNRLPGYTTTIMYYPNDLELNPDTNGVTNFSYAFTNMYYCRDTIESIMNRFDWNSCTDMSSVFKNCYNIRGFIPNIPNSVTNMSNAFYNCYSLTGSTISTIPNSVTNISYTFYNCTNLVGTIPNIPNSVTNMSNAFSNCRNLIGSIPTLPNSVTDISYAFSNCYILTGSIPTIPNSVTKMNAAFYNCSKLSSSNIYIHSNNVSNATNCFYNMGNTMNIYVHANTTTYKSFYKAMGNSTYNYIWNCYLKTF